MKRAVLVLAVIFLLSGCSGETNELERGLMLRDRILSANECSFRCEITADYGDNYESFTVDCVADSSGAVRFSVVSPDSISGITGKINEAGGNITFDDKVLAFSLLTDDQLSPVSGPWIFLRTLRSGYLTCAGMEESLLRLTIHDTYEEDALLLDIWVDEQDRPVRADVMYDDRRILSLTVKDFVIS